MLLDNISQNIRVLVADDHPVFREGLRMLLETDPKIRVVGEASDGSEAAAKAGELKPHLVLMDLRMPRCSGMEALKLFQRLSLPVRILILATEIRKMEIIEALRYGASGVVLKETATKLLRKSISTVMSGQYWIEREGISESEYGATAVSRAGSPDFSKKNWRLTPREEEIVAEVVSGKTNNEIAQTLGMSAQTVKHHLTSIFDKVGVYNRLELALFCVNNSFASEESGGEPESGPATAQNFPNNSQDAAASPKTNSSDSLGFSASGHDDREKGFKSQTPPNPAPSRANRNSGRKMP
jgi:two-component system, NarL family, nitrate/nitrite response regulator NarL